MAEEITIETRSYEEIAKENLELRQECGELNDELDDLNNKHKKALIHENEELSIKVVHLKNQMDPVRDKLDRAYKVKKSYKKKLKEVYGVLAAMEKRIFALKGEVFCTMNDQPMTQPSISDNVADPS